MAYQRYLGVLRRYFFVIVAFAIVGVASSAFLSVRQQPLYVSTTTLLINPAAPSTDIAFLQNALGTAPAQYALQQLASTYDIYLRSGSFDARVVARMQQAPGHPLAVSRIGPGTVAGEISSSLVAGTNFYQISATDPNPEIARFMANSVATEFIAQSASTLQVSSPSTTAASIAQKNLVRVQKQLDAAIVLATHIQSGPTINTPKQQSYLATVDSNISQLSAAVTQLQAQAGSSASSQPSSAKQIEPAGLPFVPSNRHVTRDIEIGGIGGLLLGVLFAYLLDYLDYAVRSPEDVETATGTLPMAVIGLVGGGRRGRQSSAAMSQGSSLPLTGNPQDTNGPAGLLSVDRPRDPVSEAFRALRTNLAFSNLGKPIRTMVVTSVLPGEGKTTTASNLAVVMAQSGKRIILVDADLRRPSVHRVFNLRKTMGLSDVLLLNGDLDAALQQTSVPNLRVLCSGSIPPNPAELLSSDAMKHVIDGLASLCDTVIFDTPPLGALTDGVVLSAQVDGSLLVVKSGSARPNVVLKGIDAIKAVGGRQLGVVLNMVDISSLRDYSYYYYYSRSGEYGEVVEGKRTGTAPV